MYLCYNCIGNVLLSCEVFIMLTIDLELTKEEMEIYQNFLKTGKAPQNKRQLGNRQFGYSSFYLDLRESGDVFLCERILEDDIRILSMHDKVSNPNVFYGYTTTLGNYSQNPIKANIVLDKKSHKKTWIDKMKENWKSISTIGIVATVAVTKTPYVGFFSAPFVYQGLKIAKDFYENMSMKRERADYVDRNKGRISEEYRDPYVIIHDKIKEKPKDKIKEKLKSDLHEFSNLKIFTYEDSHYLKKDGMLLTLTKEEMVTYRKFLQSDKPFSARLGTGLLKLHLCSNGTIVISEPADMDYGRRPVAIHDKFSNLDVFYGEHTDLYTGETVYIPYEIVMEHEKSKYVKEYDYLGRADKEIYETLYNDEEREVRYREQARFDKEADKMEAKLLQNMEINGDKVLFHFRPEKEITVNGNTITPDSDSHFIYECSVSEKDMIATQLARTIVNTMTDNYALFPIGNDLTKHVDDLAKQCKLSNQPLLSSEKSNELVKPTQLEVSSKPVSEIPVDFDLSCQELFDKRNKSNAKVHAM